MSDEKDVQSGAVAPPQRLDKDPVTGHFLPGNQANPSGRPKGGGPFTRRFRVLLEKPLDVLEDPTVLPFLRRAANILNIDQSALPELFPTFGDLLAYIEAWRAMDGEVDHLREIGDRVDPKPKRVEVSGPGGGPMRSAISGAQTEAEREAAANYMDELDNPAETE